MTDKKALDWIAIEAAYRAGVEPLRTIAEKFGLTEGAIRKRAKKFGWLRNPAAAKRAIVDAHFASSPNGAASVGGTIRDAAAQDIEDMERGLRINRLCLDSLERSATAATEPREIKIVVEAAGAAIASIRKIRGLDAPNNTDAKDIDDAIEQELAQLERERQA